jgi:archaellum biogenesis ATPase FlaH
MPSLLVITSVEKLQDKIIELVGSMNGKIGIYVSLNKTQKSIEDILKKNEIKTDKLFFIDCVTTQQTREDVLHISPRELDKLSYAINTFIKDIKGEKFLIIDALATLLIYNDENKVAAFVKEVTEYASGNKAEIIAFSPATRGEELLNKIFNFFDHVQKEDANKNEKDIDKENLIY